MKLGRREFVMSTSLLAASRTRAGAQRVTHPLGIRDDFDAVRYGTYLNTPYIGPIPRPVAEAGIDFVRAKAERPITLGAMLEKASEVRRAFGDLFGASPAEVGFLFATSEGENLVAGALGLSPGDNVVVDDLHYTTSYALYKTLEQQKGIELRIARSVEGRADPEQFEPLVDRRTRLVSVSWVSHQNGFRHDLRRLADLAHANDAYLYADGIQGLGMFGTNLRDEGVDFMTSGTYKWLFASYGIAPFYIREEHLDRVPPDRLGALSLAEERPGYEFELYSDARKYEYATLAFGPLYQLGAALEYLKRVGLKAIEDYTLPLAKELRRGLVDQGFRVRTPPDSGSAIVAFYHGTDRERAEALLRDEDIAVSFREEGTQIRAGIAAFNTREDVERFLEVTERFSGS
ncbi:MAG TPA: aminotransferase class V-fold PLP-dependent enzyme [Vicinamibacteria bacterium]|nr:aminotransferase class V-fold PLP-dependent enzyme [Vicinamibacteria bacterium]